MNRRTYIEFIVALNLIHTILLAQTPFSLSNEVEKSQPKYHLEFLKKEPFISLLMDRNYNRPSKCPLKSIKNSDLHTKLAKVTAALKYGECYDQNGEIIKGLEEMLNNTNAAYMARFNNPYAQTGTKTPQSFQPQAHSNAPNAPGNRPKTQLVDSQYTEVMHSLGDISQDDDCVSNIRKRGLLPVVAEIATTMGQTAALVPSPNGFLISAGGISLGATLKVLSRLFQSPYNWDSSSERKQFQDLNCSFFDLRRDIESAEILIPPDETIQDNMKKIQDAKLSISNTLIKIKEKQKQVMQEFLLLKQNHIKQSISPSLYEATQKIDTMLSLIEINDKSISQNLTKNKQINLLMTHVPTLLNFLKQDPNPPSYHEYLIKILEVFQWDQLEQLSQLAVPDFNTSYLEPLITYLKEYALNLKQRAMTHQSVFLESKVYNTTLSNKDQITTIDNNYSTIILSLTEQINRLDSRYAILLARSNKKNLNAYDDSAHASFDIIDEYISIQNIIYNKLGYSYLDYFRKKVSRNHYYFKKNFKLFKKDSNKSLTPSELSWLCRDAQQLRVTWEASNSANEVIWDLLETNKGIFFTHVNKIRTFLHVIPVGLSKRFSFYRNVKSAELAKEFIDKKQFPRDLKSFNKYGHRTSHNMGKLMLSIERSRPKRLELESFMTTHQCSKYL